MRIPKSRKKIRKVIMHPIEDMELYKKSLGTVMLSILEKQLGPELLDQSMRYLAEKIKRNDK